MMKKSVCSMALVAALILFVQCALAQNYKGTPHPTIQDYGPFTQTKVQHTNINREAGTGMCGNPAAACLFYGGDFVDNLVGANVANGLANETTTLVSGSPYGAATWVPFTVPTGQTWSVTGLFTNDQSDYGVLDQSPLTPTSAAYWAIEEGIEPGNAGTTIASGTAGATIHPTGRNGFGLSEYTVEVQGLSFSLTEGEYWMIVVPLCTNTGNPYCFETFFLSDVEYINTSPKNTRGPVEPQDAGFFDSPFFFFTYGVPNGPLGACAGIGCDAFSAGIQGTRN
jgi:hypothetical protein